MIAFLLVSLLIIALNHTLVLTILHIDESLKIMVELDDEVISEILRNTSTIAGRKAHHLSLLRENLDEAALVESINYHMSTIGLRKGEGHQGCTFRRTEFCRHIIVGEIDTIIIRCSLLCLMREPAGTLLLIKYRFAHDRHQ